MYMNAEVELNNSKGEALPSDAIVNFENKSYIFIGTIWLSIFGFIGTTFVYNLFDM